MRKVIKTEYRRLMIAAFMPLSPFNFLLSGLLMFLWGVWVAVPMTDAFETATFYEHLGAIMPESVWGGLAMLAGCVKLWGAWCMDRTKLMYSSLAGFFMWGILMLFYWMADATAPGTVIMTFLWLSATWHYLNLKIMGTERII